MRIWTAIKKTVMWSGVLTALLMEAGCVASCFWPLELQRHEGPRIDIGGGYVVVSNLNTLTDEVSNGPSGSVFGIRWRMVSRGDVIGWPMWVSTGGSYFISISICSVIALFIVPSLAACFRERAIARRTHGAKCPKCSAAADG